MRLARAAFQGQLGWIAVWDLAYILVLSGALLLSARRIVRRRLTS